MEILFSEAASSLAKAIVLVIALFDDENLPGRIEQININSGHFIKQAITTSEFQNGKFGETRFIIPPNGINSYPEIKSILLINAGKSENFNNKSAELIGGKIYKELKKLKIYEATILIETSSQSIIPHIANGMELSNFSFDKYKTKKEESELPKKTTFAVDANEHCQKEFQYLNTITQGTKIARTLVSEPPNVLYPDAYVQNVKEIFDGLNNVKVEILDEKSMAKLGMNALLGVGQGSMYKSRLAIMQYNGSTDKNKPPIAFVGKGVTFDTGGISLKPSRGMWDMKYDMAGSAAVVGAMYALAARDANVNAVGVIGLVENAVSATAQRPSDIVKSMSGQTIEVLNTDAEGRLVLADALSYVEEKFNPNIIVDLATLTGAIVVALGDQHAGVFSNNDELAKQIISSGQTVNEKVWRFPLSKEYDKQIDSDVADMQNISLKGTGADSITAAQFLQRFVKEGKPWAHIDIAGTAWSKEGSDISPKGATGFGVRLLNELSKKYYEDD
ncbi:MAG: leucyl aminopeptidase [Rickettsiaceae bacterium H1]|nr:leucyl aminopeptidase [Rickettsiaceae bacterium H1]